MTSRWTIGRCLRVRRRDIVRAFAGALAFTSVLGCDRQEQAPPAKTQSPLASASPGAAEPASSAPVASAHEPPKGELIFEPWKSGQKGVDPIAPPESLLEPWRVFVNQTKPRQKKNPRWQTLPPKEAVELDMAPDGSYRCLVTPIEARARPSEDYDAVEAWALTRHLRCSADGWKTWTESPHIVIAETGGDTRPVMEHTDVFLRERIGDKVRETTLILRSDKGDDGRATTGPPQVIDAPQHVED